MSKVEEVVIRADQVDEVGVTEDIWLVLFIAKVLQIINAPLFKSTYSYFVQGSSLTVVVSFRYMEDLQTRLGLDQVYLQLL